MPDPNDKTQIDIDGELFTLDYGCNMACRLEEADGKDRVYRDILEDMLKTPSATKVRRFIHAAMLPTDKATLEHAGKMVDALGGFMGLVIAWKEQREKKQPPPVAA